MKTPGQPDCFHVVNGPEDGIQFPITRMPAHIGSDPMCACHLSLDAAIRARHALITVVSDGYRIRRMDTGTVLVDGRRTGMFRSRIVRNGGAVQVGDTVLCVETAPGGLASRSHGIVSESDFGWAVQQIAHGFVDGARHGWRLLVRLFGRIVSSWLAIGVLIGVGLYFSPALRSWAWAWLSYAYAYTMYQLFGR